jgi:hypothetical protein
MNEWINEQVERINRFMVQRPGLLPLIGLLLVVINFLLQLFPGPDAWIAASNLFLHLGLVLSILGLLLVNVYRH